MSIEMKKVKPNYRDQITIERNRGFTASIFRKIFAVLEETFYLWRFDISRLCFRLKLSLRPVEMHEKLVLVITCLGGRFGKNHEGDLSQKATNNLY